jgi:hypothetical protein
MIQETLSMWRRPSGCDTSACPEVYLSRHGGGALIRNTKRRDELVSFDADDWQLFVAAVKAGEFDG